MAENKDDAQGALWPIPTFHFIVDFEGTPVVFQEVSGIDTEFDVAEYRNGNSPSHFVTKMPGLKKTSDVILKKGMSKDSSFFDYITSFQMGIVARKTITISLVDENGVLLFVWTLKNAFPIKVTGESMNAKTGEVAIEEMVLGHEGLSMLAR